MIVQNISQINHFFEDVSRFIGFLSMLESDDLRTCLMDDFWDAFYGSFCMAGLTKDVGSIDVICD